jgi:hypothetical protein
VGQHSENPFERLSIVVIVVAENPVEREATTPISSDATILKKKRVFKDGFVLLPPSSSYLNSFVVH